MVHEGSVTATNFKEFLTRLIVGATKPVFLIVDGHPIHKSKLVKDYVASLDGQLKLFYLPPYATQLHPGEQVWPHVKRQVSRQLVLSLDDKGAGPRRITAHSETARPRHIILPPA